MNLRIEPDPGYPLGGHALLILREGASVGSGTITLRRIYDNWFLGAHGWQAAETSLGPFPASPIESGHAVLLGPEVVDHLVEFTKLEIAFEGGTQGEAVWPDEVLPSPDRAGRGGLRSATEDTHVTPAASKPLSRAADATTASVRTMAPVESERIPDPAPPKDDPALPKLEAEGSERKRFPVGWVIAGVGVLAVVAYGFLNAGQFVEGEGEVGPLEACSEAAFTEDPDVDPASLIDRVHRCVEVEGVSAVALLSAVERVLDRSPEALLVMGRWYDPMLHGEDFSPFDSPSIENATRYYSEAKAAGAADAEALLRDACARLDRGDLMQNNTHKLYCPEG